MIYIKSINGNEPSSIIIINREQVWWKCSEGHSWKASFIDREKGLNCPYCSGQKLLKGFNDIATTHPQLVKEWNKEKNTIQPSNVTALFNEKIWWKAECGHKWADKISTRLSGKGCPYCSRKKKK